MTSLFGTTPGPWAVEEGIKAGLDGARFPTTAKVLVYADDDCEHHPIADCSCNHTCRMDWDCEANAKAIAQVPAMLALVDVMRTGPFAPTTWVKAARDIARQLEKGNG